MSLLFCPFRVENYTPGNTAQIEESSDNRTGHGSVWMKELREVTVRQHDQDKQILESEEKMHQCELF